MVNHRPFVDVRWLEVKFNQQRCAFLINLGSEFFLSRTLQRRVK
uniref:Uncharacterized protein n=1 Tax=Rhizophora mucronata TaxID=61149 RepID=A0A2P2Q0T8_RHIMU